MQIAILGLGKMGSRIAEKLVVAGHSAVVWNRSSPAVEELISKLQTVHTKGKVTSAKTIAAVIEKMQAPRIVWLMLPAGEATEVVLQEVTPLLTIGDILIDGANAFYKDTQFRYEKLKSKQIKFLGIGVSGGIKAAEKGYPMMVGGDRSAYETVKPILDSLATPHGGYDYFGEGGAGHFVKMVHNGIEYGMMQAMGEGFGVLEKSPYSVDLVKVAKLWQKNTIVSSFLIDCATDALEKNATLDDIEGVIDATGEAAWTVAQAKEEGVPAENIEQSLDFRRRSKTDSAIANSFAARMVAALRREFGGHAVKERQVDKNN